MPKAISHFWWLPTTLSIVLSSLGIFALALHAFVEWSLSAPVALVMAAYNETMEKLFGWALPYLQAALTWLGSFIGWRPTLYPHWRDVFVVAALLVTAVGRWWWYPVLGRTTYTVVRFFIMGTGALVAAVVSGIVPIASNGLWSQLPVVVSIAIPMSLVDLTNRDLSLRERLLNAVVYSFLLISAGLIGAWRISVTFADVKGLGLIGLSISVLFLGLMSLVGAAFRRDPRRWVVPLTILGGFVGAAFVFAVDAGLKLWGG